MPDHRPTAKLLAILAATLLATGCAINGPRYDSFIGITLALREAGIDKATVGEIRKDPHARRNVDKVRIRAMTVVSPYGSYTAYLREALATELDHAELFDAAAPTRIDGVLLTNDFGSSSGKEFAALEAQFTVTRDGRTVWQGTKSARYEWDAVFVGEVAIPRAMTNYQIAVQRLIAAFIADPGFVAALRKP